MNITKEKKLLVYIHNIQISKNEFIPSKYVDDIIKLGITKNKKSFYAMINTLWHKEYLMRRCNFTDGLYYSLTTTGIDEAEFWSKKMEDEHEKTAIPSTSHDNDRYNQNVIKSVLSDIHEIALKLTNIVDKLNKLV